MIQLPTKMSARGQKYRKIFPMMPCDCRKRSTPTTISTLPQKRLSRFILTPVPAPTAYKSTDQNIHTKYDQSDRSAVFTQNRDSAKESREDEEEDCANHDEVQAAAKVMASVFAKQPG